MRLCLEGDEGKAPKWPRVSEVKEQRTSRELCLTVGEREKGECEGYRVILHVGEVVRD